MQTIQVFGNEICLDPQVYWFYYAFLIGLGLITAGTGLILGSVHDEGVQKRISVVRKYFPFLPLPIALFGAFFDVLFVGYHSASYYFVGSFIEASILLGGFWLGVVIPNIHWPKLDLSFQWANAKLSPQGCCLS
ncbi:MAG: hypothetical protein ACXAB4_11000 [Candidatus Hodarchaeales archaeon]